jgi:flagellar biosynthetic protein FliR
MEFTDAQIGAWVGSFLWPLFRIASFMMVVPIIGTQLVPMRVRAGLAFIVTLIVAPLIDSIPVVDAVSLTAFIVVLQQVVIGTLLGFMFVFLMQLFVVAGQIVSMQMGLGFASMVDPSSGINTPILSQIFLVAVTLAFLALNGHLVMIEVIVESFRVWPISTSIIGANSIEPSLLWDMMMRINWLFASALLVALPVITSVLIVNISFGVMTRAAPQMNVFSLGFPIGMIFGFFILWMSIGNIDTLFIRFSEQTFVYLRDLMGA